MTPDIKAKWVEALRSGRYRQTQNAMREERSKGKYAHCCLGVLCNVIDPKGWRTRDDQYLDADGAEYPPKDVRVAAQVYMRTAKKLANMNDAGKSFAEIADYIEKHL